MQRYYPFILETIYIILALPVINKSFIFTTIQLIRNVSYLDVIHIRYVFNTDDIFFYFVTRPVLSCTQTQSQCLLLFVVENKWYDQVILLSFVYN